MSLWRAAARACTSILLLLLGTVPAPDADTAALAQASPSSGLTVRFLDTGSGDAAWVATTSHNYLVDCGSQLYSAQLVSILQSAGVAKLDGLIVSDARADRIGGCVDVLRALRPDFVLWPRTPNSPDGAALVAIKNALQIRTQDWTVEGVFFVDGAQATVLNPSAPEAPARDEGDSLALAIDYQGVRILLVDDDGRAAGQSAAARVLRVSSHATSAFPADQVFADLGPEYVIAATPRSGMGGPDANVLGALQRDVQAVWNDGRNHFLSTGQNGTVAVVLSASDSLSAGPQVFSDR